MNDPTDVFEEHRPLLLGLAYRLLGSMWDAEDAVQEGFLRWMGADRSEIREPRAFLVTVVSRIALDQLKSARVTREAYTGPWLPEPVASDAFGPLDTAELRDTLRFATLHLMERLSPPERAVFVLREAFELPYDDIAAIVDASAAACRQLHHRAARKLADGRDRFQPSAAEHRQLLSSFLQAAQNGDLEALTGVLAADVTAWNDGGGKVSQALRPVVGSAKVATFVLGLAKKYPIGGFELVDVNCQPAAWITMGDKEQLFAFDIVDGQVLTIYGILNPDKLTRVRPAA
ncbi:sigma-70 family RNA polymerase sigma factor family protein [Flindersiella endophytica]